LPPIDAPSPPPKGHARIFAYSHSPPGGDNYQSRLRRQEWIPARGPVERMLSSLPPPSELALARQTWGRDRNARTGNKLTDWGTPRPHCPTPCDARQHGNRQRHSFNIGLRQPAKPPYAPHGRLPATDRRHPSLPSLRFQALLTLFSGSFSSFPRGTCSLSVSRHVFSFG